MKTKISLLALFVFLIASSLQAATIEDDAGQKLNFQSPPQKVVSLLPSVTEVMVALGAADNLIGRTYHDQHLPEVVNKQVVGGAFSPHFDIIAGLKPDLLIMAPRDYEKAKKELEKYNMADCPILVWNDGDSLAMAEIKINNLGVVFDKRKEAEAIIKNNNDYFEVIKLKNIKNRKRVIRVLLDKNKILSPGNDSFQTELIKGAGGLAPDFGPGAFVPVSAEKWREFNPEIIYACGPDKKELTDFLKQPDWQGVEAVKDNNIHHFPCALTCRAAANTGYFAAWLASVIYSDEFADVSKLARPNAILGERQLALDIPYVAKARVVESRLMDFNHRTLLIDFKNPQRVMSTVNGQRSGILTAGNTHSPTAAWSAYHKMGFEGSQKLLLGALGLDHNKSDIMSTGADMDNLSVKTFSFKDLSVTAMATAGVEGNAFRSSKDVGGFFENPGTINIIVLTNRHLTDRAASRALITITEAKTAALWDMDIRSVQSPLNNPATGTGTDNIIVVQGEGVSLDYSGGHSKLGQLISESVYAAVQDALLKQNAKVTSRNFFERLEERGLSVHKLFDEQICLCRAGGSKFQYDFETLLMDAKYTGFLEAAFLLTDIQSMGRAADLSAFDLWAQAIASEIAGQPVKEIENVINQDMPKALGLAINALATGLNSKYRQLDSKK